MSTRGRPGESMISGHLFSRTITINFLRLCWAILIIWGELGVFFWSLSSCKWPDFKDYSPEAPTHVLLISDTHVRHLSRFWERVSLTNYFRDLVFDLNLRKSWRTVTRMKPDVVIFLGDLLAGGKSVKSEAEYQQLVRKFESIFTLSRSIPVYYIPGNNDIGMGVSPTFSNAIRGYYSKAFGPFNQLAIIRNHTFVFLDAPGLVDEDYQRSASGIGFDQWNPIPRGPVSFVKNIERGENPLVLFSHIPLARPDTAFCGPLRERGTIRKGVGHGYQNTFGKHTTAFLLQTLQPSSIYSGDNRDYCEYVHTIGVGTSTGVREVTVKSFSMSNYIRHPGFQLLSLTDPSSMSDHAQKSFIDRPCTLPDQYGIYFAVYVPFVIVTALILLVVVVARRGRVSHIERLWISPQSSGNPHSSRPPDPDVIWSPYTAAVPSSPISELLTHLRTPSTSAGATFRTSRSGIPLGSPLLPPAVYIQENDDETIQPTQYTAWKDLRSLGVDSRTQYNGVDLTFQIPRFTSAPRSTSSMKGWSWSWSFIFRRRRRRMTLRAPVLSWRTPLVLGSLLNNGGLALLRHHVINTVLRDGFSIFWPVVIIWVLVTWVWP